MIDDDGAKSISGGDDVGVVESGKLLVSVHDSVVVPVKRSGCDILIKWRYVGLPVFALRRIVFLSKG